MLVEFALDMIGAIVLMHSRSYAESKQNAYVLFTVGGVSVPTTMKGTART
jgi:hypothetical protein